jgi:hypothetical protein
MQRTAQCQCGSLRAIASGEPTAVYACHCLSCQQRTGSVLFAGASFLRTHVRYEGPSKAYARRADSGLEIRFYFCPECGTSVYYESDKSPDLCGIAVGCFADPGFPPPHTFGLGRKPSPMDRAANRYLAPWERNRRRGTSYGVRSFGVAAAVRDLACAPEARTKSMSRTRSIRAATLGDHHGQDQMECHLQRGRAFAR